MKYSRLIKRIFQHLSYIIQEEIEDEKKRCEYEEKRLKRDPNRFCDKVNKFLQLNSDTEHLWIAQRDLSCFGVSDDIRYFKYYHQYGVTMIHGSFEIVPGNIATIDPKIS